MSYLWGQILKLKRAFQQILKASCPQILFILSAQLISVSTLAEIPVEIKLHKQNFKFTQIFDHLQEQDNNKEASLQSNDPHSTPLMINQVFVEYERILSEFGIQKDLAHFKKEFNSHVKQYENEYQPKMWDYIEKNLKKHEAQKTTEGPLSVYRVKNGIAFYKDLFEFKGVDDHLIEALVMALFNNKERVENTSDFLERMLYNLRNSDNPQSFIFTEKDMTENDFKTIEKMVYLPELNHQKVGSYWVLGSGIPFYVLTNLIEKGSQLLNPDLQKKFHKTLQYHANFNIPVKYEYVFGSYAFFTPARNIVSFSKSSPDQLNTYTHEVMHSRFRKFTKTLDSWCEQKGYKVPFHIDGPSRGEYSDKLKLHGGLFNLLNEINSWRLGESFSYEASDKRILSILKQHYGSQSGEEAIEILDKIWTPEKIEGQSIPLLIYQEIKKFNQMTLSEIFEMGLEGLADKDLTKKMNFLIHYESGKFKDSVLEDYAEALIRLMAKKSTEKLVLKKIEKINNDILPQPKPKRVIGAGFKSFLTKSPKNLDYEIEQPTERLIKDITSDILHEKSTDKIKISFQLFEMILKKELIESPLFNEDNEHRVREPIDSLWISTLDHEIATKFYEGAYNNSMIRLLRLISEYFRPEELPKTYAQTLAFLKKDTSYKKSAQLILSINFIIPEESKTQKENPTFLWGQKLIQDLEPDFNGLSASLKTNMALLYQEVLALRILPKPNFTKKLNSLELNRNYDKLDGFQKQSLEIAGRQLWTLAGDQNAQVRAAAMYALNSNPLFYTQIEGRMVQSLLHPDLHPELDWHENIEFFIKTYPQLFTEAVRIDSYQKRNSARKEALMGLSCKTMFD